MITINNSGTWNVLKHYKGINPEIPINIHLSVDCKDNLFTYSAAPKNGKCMTDMVITKDFDIEGVSNFTLKLAQKGEELLTVDGVFIDEWEKGPLEEFGGDMARMVESHDKTASEAFLALQHWKEFNHVEDDMNTYFRCSVFIRQLSVHPKYRNMGVASFALNHLGESILKKYGLNLAYVCTMVPPIFDEKTTQLIKKALESMGFVNLPGECSGDVYAKRCKRK